MNHPHYVMTWKVTLSHGDGSVLYCHCLVIWWCQGNQGNCKCGRKTRPTLADLIKSHDSLRKDKARAKRAILRGSVQAKSSGYCYNVRTLWSVVTAKIGAAQPFKLRGNPLFEFLLDGRQIGQVLNLFRREFPCDGRDNGRVRIIGVPTQAQLSAKSSSSRSTIRWKAGSTCTCLELVWKLSGKVF